jgi:PIN domain nuclease of toxin-antitoxin system
VVLLDTHAFVWLVSSPALLSAKSKEFISQNENRLYLSVISSLEIALLFKRGRLNLPKTPDIFIELAIDRYGIHELEIDRQTMLQSVDLPAIHSDPFDRIIIATAMGKGLSLITKDKIISMYPKVTVVW